MNWRATLAIARKDIVDAVRNLYVLFGITFPIGLSLLFGLVFPSADELGTLTVAVHDPRDSRLVAGLRALPQVRLLEVASYDQLPRTVEKSAVGGLAPTAGFDAAVEAGERPELTVFLNRRRGGGEIAAFQQLVERQVWALVGQEAPAHINWANVASPPGAGADGEFNVQRYLLIMLLVVGLVMAGTFVVPTLLVEEKEKHTLDALLLSPAGPAEVTAGKAMAGLLYALLISAALLALNGGWMGNWPMTVLSLLLGALFVVAVGLLMGGIFHNASQVNTWSSIVMLLLMAPSWVGVFGNVTALEVSFHLIPTFYLSRALDLSMAGRGSPAPVWGNLAALAVSTVVAYAAVIWSLRREEN